jgi:hypothetical protein
VWVKPPLESAATTPVELIPSPQSIVALKSPARAFGLPLVMLATWPVEAAPSVAAKGMPVAVTA